MTFQVGQLVIYRRAKQGPAEPEMRGQRSGILGKVLSEEADGRVRVVFWSQPGREFTAVVSVKALRPRLAL